MKSSNRGMGMNGNSRGKAMNQIWMMMAMMCTRMMMMVSSVMCTKMMRSKCLVLQNETLQSRCRYVTYIG